MGKTITPKYRLEIKDNKGWHIQGWTGSPTKLETWLRAYHRSLKLGGVNEHISKALGYIPHVNHAKIINQKTGQVVKEYKAAMFQEID